MSCLLIDTNYLCHRAFYTTGKLSFQGVGTGVVFGVLREIKNLQDLHGTNEIIFFFDYGTSYRKNLLPTYKGDREDKLPPDQRKELNRQIRMMRTSYLKEIGFNNVFFREGFEADDLIAKHIKTYWEQEFIIVSADKDLNQLLRNRVSIWNPTKEKMITKKSFVREWGIPPIEWARVEAITGGHNCLPGVEGVGPKTAIKYLLGTLDPTSKAANAIEFFGNKQIEANMRLTFLPYPGTPSFKVQEDKVSEKKWRVLTDKLGITSLREKHKLVRSGFGVGL